MCVCVRVLPAGVSRFPRTEVTDGCPPCGCRESKLGSLQEQVRLTAESSFQPLY